jgi:hypothetical protein
MMQLAESDLHPNGNARRKLAPPHYSVGVDTKSVPHRHQKTRK